MASYQERRAQCWMLQVRKIGTQECWSVTGRTFFNSRDEVNLYIANEILADNFKYLEYRAARYIPAHS